MNRPTVLSMSISDSFRGLTGARGSCGRICTRTGSPSKCEAGMNEGRSARRWPDDTPFRDPGGIAAHD